MEASEEETPPLLTPVTVYSLLACAAQFAVGYIIAQIWGRKCSPADRWVLVWLFYDAIVHITLEGPFVYMSLVGTVAQSDNMFAELWKEYGKADTRWLHADPTIVALELLTVFLCSFLALLLVHAITTDQHYRHLVQVSLSVCELYGGWMTFCPDWLAGWPSLSTGNALHLWVYLVFFNGVWVLAPALLLRQSWGALRRLHASAREDAALRKLQKLQ